MLSRSKKEISQEKEVYLTTKFFVGKIIGFKYFWLKKQNKKILLPLPEAAE